MEPRSPTNLTPAEVQRFNEILAEFLLHHNEAHLEELFRLFDRNGNGLISPDELKVVLETIEGHVVSDDKVQAMMKAADINSDGAIELSEFMKVIRRLNN